MREELRLEPGSGFKLVLAVTAGVHLLVLGGFLMLSLHPPKRVDKDLVWVNPGSFVEGNPSKISDGTPAASAVPSAPALNDDEPPPKAAPPVTAPAEPAEAPAALPAPAVAESVPPPETPPPVTPPPLPPVPAASEVTLATTPTPPRPTPMPVPTPKPTPVSALTPAPKPAPKPKPRPSPTPGPKPKPSPSATPRPKASPRVTPKPHTTPNPSPKPKPGPNPAPAESPEATANPKPSATPKAGLTAKNGEKAPRAERVDNGTAEPAGDTGNGTGSGQAAGNSESKLAYYAEVIKNRFQAAWNQPRGEIKAGTQLVATVRLRIQPDGTVTEFTLIEGSGSSVVDESVRAAGRQITRLPPPPGGTTFNPVVRFELGD